MAISSITSNDLALNTSTLTITGDALESIIYTKSTNSFAFSPQLTFTVTPTQYLQFAAILIAYNTNIINIFNPSFIVSTPFNVTNISDTNDGVSTLNFLCNAGGHRLYSIASIYPAGNCVFAARLSGTTLTFDELQLYLTCSIHYKNEIIKSFNL